MECHDAGAPRPFRTDKAQGEIPSGQHATKMEMEDVGTKSRKTGQQSKGGLGIEDFVRFWLSVAGNVDDAGAHAGGPEIAPQRC